MQVEGTPEQATALFNALREAQAEFPPIPKSKSAYNYKYAPLADIHALTRLILVRHGLFVFHPIDRCEGKQSVGTVIAHKDGGRVSCQGFIVPETAKTQEQGGVVTYGSRYGYCSMLGITSQDDDDAQLAAAKGPRGNARRGVVVQSVERRDGGDPGAIPGDPLPTLQERKGYAQKIAAYKQYVELSDLEAYLLSQTGAPEAKQITKRQWEEITVRLDAALYLGPGELKKLIGAS